MDNYKYTISLEEDKVFVLDENGRRIATVSAEPVEVLLAVQRALAENPTALHLIEIIDRAKSQSAYSRSG